MGTPPLAISARCAGPTHRATVAVPAARALLAFAHGIPHLQTFNPTQPSSPHGHRSFPPIFLHHFFVHPAHTFILFLFARNSTAPAHAQTLWVNGVRHTQLMQRNKPEPEKK